MWGVYHSNENTNEMKRWNLPVRGNTIKPIFFFFCGVNWETIVVRVCRKEKSIIFFQHSERGLYWFYNVFALFLMSVLKNSIEKCVLLSLQSQLLSVNKLQLLYYRGNFFDFLKKYPENDIKTRFCFVISKLTDTVGTMFYIKGEGTFS